MGTVDSGGSTSTNVEVPLAAFMDPGAWGTYTYDVLIQEVAQTDTWMGQMDPNYFKWPYYLLVPGKTPEVPERDGHHVWFEDQDLKASYWLSNTYGHDAQGITLIAVGPLLEEKGQLSGPVAQGVMHGAPPDTVHPDGMAVYRMHGSDQLGLWRVLFTGSDECGIHSPWRRTHDYARMPVTNELQPSGPGYVLLIDPGHGQFYDADTPLNMGTRAISFRGSDAAFWVPYADRAREDDIVLAIGRDALARANGSYRPRGVLGGEISRLDEWDLGLRDRDPVIGSHRSTALETPVGKRSLDMRVRWAKARQAALWGRGFTHCLYLGIHTNASSTPFEYGVCRVLDPQQGLKAESAALGGYALCKRIRRTLGTHNPDPFEKPIQVLDMLTKNLALDRDRDDERYDAKLRALEPEVTKRRAMPAMILEVGHHNQTAGRSPTNHAVLASPELQHRIGALIVSGVGEWIGTQDE